MSVRTAEILGLLALEAVFAAACGRTDQNVSAVQIVTPDYKPTSSAPANPNTIPYYRSEGDIFLILKTILLLWG